MAGTTGSRGRGVETRIPFIDSVLVIDVREKVREFKAEKMLTKDNVSVTIDTILRYRIMSAPRATPKISVMQR